MDLTVDHHSLKNPSRLIFRVYRFGAARPTLIGRRPIPVMCCISISALCWSVSSEKRTKPKPLLLPLLSRTTARKRIQMPCRNPTSDVTLRTVNCRNPSLLLGLQLKLSRPIIYEFLQKVQLFIQNLLPRVELAEIRNIMQFWQNNYFSELIGLVDNYGKKSCSARSLTQKTMMTKQKISLMVLSNFRYKEPVAHNTYNLMIWEFFNKTELKKKWTASSKLSQGLERRNNKSQRVVGNISDHLLSPPDTAVLFTHLLLLSLICSFWQRHSKVCSHPHLMINHQCEEKILAWNKTENIWPEKK